MTADEVFGWGWISERQDNLDRIGVLNSKISDASHSYAASMSDLQASAAAASARAPGPARAEALRKIQVKKSAAARTYERRRTTNTNQIRSLQRGPRKP
jgi:hypothetical protein